MAIKLKTLTTQDLDDVQLICERAIKTAIGNFNNGFGRLEDLYEIAKVIQMLGMVQASDEDASGAAPSPRAKKAA